MPTFVQKNINVNTATAVTTLAVTCSAVITGNLVCGFITQADANQTCTVKDNNSVSATMVPSSTGVLDATNGQRSWMWYSPNVSGGPTSYTATFSAAGGPVASISLQEWSGVATTSPLDQSNLVNLATSTNPKGTAVTPGSNGQLIFSGVTADSNSPGTISAGTVVSWTMQNNNAGAGTGDESFVQATAASIQGEFHFTATAASQLGIMTFKAAAAAGLPPGDQITNRPDPVMWYQNWVSWKHQTPTIKNTFGGNYPWPNPSPVIWYNDWSQRSILSSVSPFYQHDWPNPQPINWYVSYTQNLLQSTLSPLIQSVISEYQWNIPSPVYWYEDWSQSLSLRLPTPVFIPFKQTDWPNPLPMVWYQSWTRPGNVQLPFPTPFFQNVDSPLPVVSQHIDPTWIQSLNNFLQSETFPFSQKDWPLPYPIQWYRDYYQALALYLPVGPKPFSQSDWPLPIGNVPIDQSFWQNIINLFPPPPPPPPEQIFGSKTWTREEWTRKLTQYVQQRQKLLTFSEMGKMGGRPRKHT